jgi:hypothetical protein
MLEATLVGGFQVFTRPGGSDLQDWRIQDVELIAE